MPNTEGWLQAGELGLALLLSAAIGLEREVRQKSAGLRTHTLVGVGAALVPPHHPSSSPDRKDGHASHHPQPCPHAGPAR
jgi:MgtC family